MVCGRQQPYEVEEEYPGEDYYEFTCPECDDTILTGFETRENSVEPDFNVPSIYRIVQLPDHVDCGVREVWWTDRMWTAAVNGRVVTDDPRDETLYDYAQRLKQL